jgi:hypothetical protein
VVLWWGFDGEGQERREGGVGRWMNAVRDGCMDRIQT